MYSTIIIFITVLLLYLHIIYATSIQTFESIGEIDFHNNSQLQEICSINKPFVFKYNYYDSQNININKLMMSKYLKVNVFSNNNNKSTIINFNKAIPLFNKDNTTYYTYLNNDLICNNTIINNLSNLDKDIKPPMYTNVIYDIILGSINSYTPTTYHNNNRCFLFILQGKIQINTVSLKYKNDFSDIWKKERKIPIIESNVNQGYIFYLPSNVLYSIKLLEKNTLVWSISYDSIITSSINIFNTISNKLNYDLLF
tara:strand:- start:179 stop:943 length:765 start_codon:yes stop_codon:yes gene_type:complete